MPGQLQPLSADRLEHLLQERSEMSQRPRPTPRQVVATWMENFGVGGGAGIAAAVLLYVLRAPADVLATGSVSIGLLTFAGMMAWRGSLDERSDWRNTRAVRRTVTAMRQEFDGQVRTLRRQLDAAFDEIETLERSLDQTAHERDMALLDLGRERQLAQAGQRQTFVSKEAALPQDVKDAQEMIHHYFATRQHLSRRQADDLKQWPATRHDAAQKLLLRSGVLAINQTQPKMLAQTLGEAVGRLNTYLVHARSAQAPPIVQTAGNSTYQE